MLYGDWTQPWAPHPSPCLYNAIIIGCCRLVRVYIRGLVGVYTGHRVQGVWSIRGRYGGIWASACIVGMCMGHAIKWLYSGRWVSGRYIVIRPNTGVPPLSLIPVTALIPGYPSLSPGAYVTMCHSFFLLLKMPEYSRHPRCSRRRTSSFLGSPT